MNCGRSTPRAARARTLAASCALAFAATALGGCATSRLGDHWRDPAFAGPPMHNLLVMVVRKDPVRRRVWEDAFVAELKRRGLLASPSYRSFPDSVPSQDALEDVMKQTAFDGILLSRRMGTQEYRHYVPPMVTTFGGGPGWGHFWGHYHSYYQTTVVSPGYAETERVVINETTIWDARHEGAMIWSGTVHTSNPRTVNELAEAQADVIVSRLAEDHVIR